MDEFLAVRQSVLESGRLYEDPDFPANESSIRYTHVPGWDGIEWRRPGDLVSEPKLRVENASRFDLAQGDISNCWFLSAATNLAIKPELFDRVVPPEQTFTQDYAGIFLFRFWRYGEWLDVTVDDRLPVKNGKLIFCHNRTEPEEFWGALLEKAYAKVHGSYQALESGYSHDALVDFTGGIGEFIDLTQETGGSGRVFKTIKRTHKMNSLLCASIDIREDGAFEDKLENGLVTGHAYSITNVAEVEVDGCKHQLLRLRNPWGCKEWNGAWSDTSTDWNSLNDVQKQRLNMNVADDGEFWMPLEDFMTNYNSLSICHLTPDSVRSKTNMKRDWEVVVHHGSWVPGISAGGAGIPPHTREYWSNPQYLVRAVDPDETDDVDTCTVVVSLIQKYRRQHKTIDKTTEVTEEAIAFDLLKFNDDNVEELDEQNYDHKALRMERKMLSYEFLRERAGRFDLSPGVYCIIPCTYSPNKEGEFMLRIATEKPVTSEEIGSSTGTTESTSLPPRPSKFTRLFNKHSGEDSIVDAREMKKIINNGIRAESNEEYSKETCRSLVAWVQYPEKGGTLDHDQCQKAWKEVKRLQGIFEEFDIDESATLNRGELKKAFQATGVGLSKTILGSLTKHYCGKQKGLSVDEFVLLSVKIATLFEKYRKKGKKTGMTLDEWLETNLLL